MKKTIKIKKNLLNYLTMIGLTILILVSLVFATEHIVPFNVKVSENDNMKDSGNVTILIFNGTGLTTPAMINVTPPDSISNGYFDELLDLYSGNFEYGKEYFIDIEVAGENLNWSKDGLTDRKNFTAWFGNIRTIKQTLNKTGLLINRSDLSGVGAGSALKIVNEGGKWAIEIDQNSTSSIFYSTNKYYDDDDVHVSLGDANHGTLGTNYFYRNQKASETAGPLFHIEEANDTADQPTLKITDYGSGNALEITNGSDTKLSFNASNSHLVVDMISGNYGTGLELKSTNSENSPRLYFANGTNTRSWAIMKVGAGNYLTFRANATPLVNSGTAVMNLDQGGGLAIGKSNPYPLGHALYVYGNATISDGQFGVYSSTAALAYLVSSTTHANFEIDRATSDSRAWVKYSTAGTGNWYVGTVDASDVAGSTGGEFHISGPALGTPNFWIENATGYIGINTTNPVANLHVNGTVQIDTTGTDNALEITNGSDTKLSFNASAARLEVYDNLNQPYVEIRSGGANSGYLKLSNGTSGRGWVIMSLGAGDNTLSFRVNATRGTSSGTEVMNIDQKGYLSFGKPNPSGGSALTVNGNASIEGNLNLNTYNITNARIGDVLNVACAAANEAEIRYNYSIHNQVVCNSTDWHPKISD